MFGKNTYKTRRQGLVQQLDKGLIFLMGNENSPVNYTDNHYHFRQDSSFLYYIGVDQPSLAAIIDIEANECTIYGDDASVEMVVWTGPQKTMAEHAALSGIEHSAPYQQLSRDLGNALAKGRAIHILPPYRPENKITLSKLLKVSLEEISNFISTPLIKAIVKQRSIKSEEEIQQMELALDTSAAMHIAAMKKASAGMLEAELAGLVEGIAVAGGGHLAYPVILTVNGQTLHNHYHGNQLKEGQLVLGDFGAESQMHYAGDITRTFPVSASFTPQQKEIYEIVLAAEKQVIEALKPGVLYMDMHKKAAAIITEGLQSLGLMKGDIDASVAAGAHALFFPHGLGHMIGLDVHDMEDLGEDLVGYDNSIQRNPMFGYKSLRLGRKLEAGFVLTVEPGIYFIPELIQAWKAEAKHMDYINYKKLEPYFNFSGVRIEDTVLITDTGSRILGAPIPKEIEEVEALRAGV